jgi:GNAT superfamily N-acetyltransferase
MHPTIYHGYSPGCIGRIAEIHGRYYANLAGFGVEFEAKVARELAEFCLRFVSGTDGLWIAQVNDQVHGAIAIDAAHVAREGAHLRWFIASDDVRGRGIGNKLLSKALEFCDAQHYSQVYLWTFEGLDAARHLYEKFGFKLVQQQPGRQWGCEVNEQRFERRA